GRRRTARGRLLRRVGTALASIVARNRPVGAVVHEKAPAGELIVAAHGRVTRADGWDAGGRAAGEPCVEGAVEGMDEIVHEFLVESHENLDQLDSDLVALESSPGSRELLSSIFRTI